MYYPSSFIALYFHSISLIGAIEALKASTLRLPVVGGAIADVQSLKDAISSAVDVMQAMGSSICSLLPMGNLFFALLNALRFLGLGVLAALYALTKMEKDASDATINSLEIKLKEKEAAIISLKKKLEREDRI